MKRLFSPCTGMYYKATNKILSFERRNHYGATIMGKSNCISWTCMSRSGHRCTCSNRSHQTVESLFSEDEEVVCVTENDACGVDGIQAILSCTAGKGNLKFRDTGKMAFSFLTVKWTKSSYVSKTVSSRYEP